MMYNYPFFSFPRFRRYYSPYSYYSPKNAPISTMTSNFPKYEDTSCKSSKENMQNKHKLNVVLQNANDDSCDDGKVLFEILGIKLYYDDVLLICLIFFLYQEGVQDKYLFFALILLLLS